MSIGTTKKVLRDFLGSGRHDVLALTGAWGVGKTHAWREALVVNKAVIKLPAYCYVSLFGVRNLADLRTAIFLKSQPVAALGADQDEVKWKWNPFNAPRLKRLYENFGSALNGLPFAKNLTASVETMAPHYIHNMLICLDDFERTSLKPDEVLGLICELKEEKQCKVALIFNFDEMENPEGYRSYKEKVVDIEVSYAPTVDEAAAHAIPLEFPERSRVVEHARDLQITNIRILRKIRDIATLVLTMTKGRHPEVQRAAIASTVLFCWCAYGTHPTRPDLGEISEWNRKLLMPNLKKDEVLPEREAEIASLLRRYGFMHVDDLDLAIARLVSRGFLEESGLLEEVNKLDAALQGRDKADAFSNVWSRFHGTFLDDRDDFVNQLYSTALSSVELISVGNLNSTVSLLRELNRGDLSDALIECYVEAHSSRPETFDLTEHPFGGSIDDAKLRERFERAYKALAKLPSLSEAVYFMVEKSGWNTEHLAALKRATTDDFYNFFLEDHEYAMHSKLIKRCISWEGENAEIGVKAVEALSALRAAAT